jgi:hypothetical protein
MKMHDDDLAPARSRRAGPRRRRFWLLLAAPAAVLVAAAITLRLFVWPAEGMPPRVSAIVMMNNWGNPLQVALRLARQHRAGYLVISQGTPANDFACPGPVAGVRLICFHPGPATTQGEAEYAGRLAKRYHWRSIALVTIVPQASRGRLRMKRCFPGRVYTVTAPIAASTWPEQITYQWGALIKALVFQRGC